MRHKNQASIKLINDKSQSFTVPIQFHREIEPRVTCLKSHVSNLKSKSNV